MMFSLGLAQLYQLRGRVGRAKSGAQAYLTIARSLRSRGSRPQPSAGPGSAPGGQSLDDSLGAGVPARQAGHDFCPPTSLMRRQTASETSKRPATSEVGEAAGRARALPGGADAGGRGRRTAARKAGAELGQSLTAAGCRPAGDQHRRGRADPGRRICARVRVVQQSDLNVRLALYRRLSTRAEKAEDDARRWRPS